MTNVAGSSAALPGATNSRLAAQASARNTAFSTVPPRPLTYAPFRLVLRLPCYRMDVSRTPFRRLAGASSGSGFDVCVAGIVSPDGYAKSVMQARQQSFSPLRTRLKRTTNGQVAQPAVTDLDLQRRVTHQHTNHIGQRQVQKIQTAAAPGQQPGELVRIDLPDDLGRPLYVDLLDCFHRGGTLSTRIGSRMLIRCRVGHHLHNALADRHLGPCRPQVNIECRTDCPHPCAACVDPEWPPRVMGYLEEGLAALQENHARTSTIGHPHATVGIEVERRAIRQLHCGLLADSRLNPGHLLLPVQTPGSTENDCRYTCGHGDGRPSFARCRRSRGSVHHLAKIHGPNQRPRLHELVPSHGKVCIGLCMAWMSADPGVKARAVAFCHVVCLQPDDPFTGLALNVFGVRQPMELTHGPAPECYIGVPDKRGSPASRVLYAFRPFWARCPGGQQPPCTNIGETHAVPALLDIAAAAGRPPPV